MHCSVEAVTSPFQAHVPASSPGTSSPVRSLGLMYRAVAVNRTAPALGRVTVDVDVGMSLAYVGHLSCMRWMHQWTRFCVRNWIGSRGEQKGLACVVTWLAIETYRRRRFAVVVLRKTGRMLSLFCPVPVLIEQKQIPAGRRLHGWRVMSNFAHLMQDGCCSLCTV